MKKYAVAPIHTGGVAMRHGGPRDATLSPALDLDVELLEPDRVTSPLTPVRTVR
jgi:hypothetical protein